MIFSHTDDIRLQRQPQSPSKYSDIAFYQMMFLSRKAMESGEGTWPGMQHIAGGVIV